MDTFKLGLRDSLGGTLALGLALTLTLKAMREDEGAGNGMPGEPGLQQIEKGK